MNETFVYIIVPKFADGPCKVGISGNPESRAHALQSGSPVPLRLAEVYAFPNRNEALRMEQEFHASYADWRLHGEWFDVSFDDANYWLFENVVAPDLERAGL